MTKTFLNRFDPPSASPVNAAIVDLEVADREDAEIREVLQTPRATYGAWFILDTQLTPTGVGTPFIFRDPLGHLSRETRRVNEAGSGRSDGRRRTTIA